MSSGVQVDERFKEIPVADETEKEIREKFGITDSFIICTGGADGRKNLDGLIRAFGAMPKELKEQYQLVIVCKLSQEAVDGFMKLAKESDADGRVICTNFVTDEELLILYNLAHLTAFPSKYEGFGLPVVESWACGTPVLTSNNSSLVEVGGDGAVLVNPNDVSDITRGLVQALSETDLEELLQKGKKRLERFRWKVVAEDTLKFIRAAYDKHEKTNQDLTKEEKPEKIYADKKWAGKTLCRADHRTEIYKSGDMASGKDDRLCRRCRSGLGESGHGRRFHIFCCGIGTGIPVCKAVAA